MFRWYNLAAGYFLYNTIGAFSALDRLVYGEWAYKSGDKLTQTLNFIAILAGAALFWRGFQNIKRIDTGAKLVILLAVFLISSMLWSIDPQVSARRGILYLFFVSGTIGIAYNLDGDEFMRLLGDVCFLSAVFSVGLLAISPAVAIMPDGAELRGVYSHKSVLGQAMSTGAMLSLYRIRVDGARRLRGIVMLMLFVLMTVAAQSMTSLLTIVAFCGVECVIVLLRRGGVVRFLGICLIFFLVPILVIGAIFPDQILEMLGKDPTLTGRADLWVYVNQAIAERPILGWGLLAFWSETNPLSDSKFRDFGLDRPQAHNGLLEMLLEVGVVGTIFFGFVLIRNIVIRVP